MLGKSFFAETSSRIRGIRFFSNELFSDFYVVEFFKGSNMAGDVAVGHLEQLFKRVKVDTLINQQNRHDTQPNSALKCFVYLYTGKYTYKTMNSQLRRN